MLFWRVQEGVAVVGGGGARVVSARGSGLGGEGVSELFGFC